MKRTIYMAGAIATAIGFTQRPLSAADEAPNTPLPLDLNSHNPQAGARVSLQGQVVDQDDRGVSNAVVIAVEHAGPSVSQSRSAKRVQVTADESGRFLFSDLPPGRYVLVAIHGHHSPGHSDPVVVGQFGLVVPLRLQLGPAAPRA
jgi:protocatechuate 3,4-dioxygenase beta subunit